MAQEVVENKSLVDVLFTSTQQRVYSILFGQPETSFYLTEIVRLANIGRGGIQRELDKLESVGLVHTSRIGNQKHYQANPDSPLFSEIVSIVQKTVGLKLSLIEALEPISEFIDLAFVYGSVAKGADRSSSDIDVMIVSNKLTLEKVFSTISPFEARLGRIVNPTLYTEAEFTKKRNSVNGFVNKVLATPIVELIGSVDVD